MTVECYDCGSPLQSSGDMCVNCNAGAGGHGLPHRDVTDTAKGQTIADLRNQLDAARAEYVRQQDVYDVVAGDNERMQPVVDAAVTFVDAFLKAKGKPPLSFAGLIVSMTKAVDTYRKGTGDGA